MRFDPVAAAFALIGFVVVASAPSPSWESIGAGAVCALVALVVRLRPVRRTKGLPVQGSPGALPQQSTPSTPLLYFKGFMSAMSSYVYSGIGEWHGTIL